MMGDLFKLPRVEDSTLARHGEKNGRTSNKEASFSNSAARVSFFLRGIHGSLFMEVSVTGDYLIYFLD